MNTHERMTYWFERLVRCGLLRRHWAKFSSYPYCVLCGKDVRK